jgi:hypothetical protein
MMSTFAFIAKARARMRAIGLAFGCLIALAACGLQYAEPTDDQTAELSISSNAPLVLNFYRDATRCTDVLQVRQPTTGPIKIPANREFALRFFYIAGTSQSWIACDENIVSFNPERGGQYVLHYALDHSACRWAITEKSGERETPIHVWKRERDPNLTSMGGEGAWCKARASL